MNEPRNWLEPIAGGTRVAALGVLLSVGAAWGQLTEKAPEELTDVGIEEHLDAVLPLELTFRDETGQEVALGSFFRAGHPVVLNLVYFDCPMLCNVFLDGFTASLQDLDWTPGQEFEVVTVSIDPEDDAAGALKKRERYVEVLGRPEAAQGWHFLTGSQENITALANAVGFRYRLDDMSGEYQHTTAIFLATPEGRLSRYLYGVQFDPRTLRLSLVEASDGRIGTATDQILLFCFSYDHTAGRYGPAAMNLMRAFGALCVVALGSFIALNVRRESRRKSAVTLGA
ncbi:MAG: photosynthetic protein synthase I [Gemmatimonadota bacterium]|nr:MAG: photosynthetic protein synthase I [Gemmatimonadota bacterium]